ncbi:MAG: hypothetical protein OXG52_10120 [bacterium]|nr:hypothetical protein [bacterium]
MNQSAPVRAAVVSPYWTFWEASAGGAGLREDRRELLSDAVETLRGALAEPLETACVSLLDSPESAAAAARGLSGDLDLILTVVTMAAPPTHGLEFLDRFESVPLVVWSLQRLRNIRAGFDASDITSAGTAVGTPQLTNMLARSGRPHEIVVGALDDAPSHERVARAVQVAATASALRRARIARVGQPPPGYACVDSDPEALRRATGIKLVDVEAADLRRRIGKVSSEVTERLAAEAEAAAEIAGDLAAASADVPGTPGSSPPGPQAPAANPRPSGRAGSLTANPRSSGRPGSLTANLAGRRSLAAAAALEALDDELQVAAGAINCHVPELRFSGEVGVAPCYGLGRETSRGIPWTCAGDVLTAVAMLVGKRLGGAALYHELEVIDFDTDEVAIANSGEHDLAWCPTGTRPRLQPNPWYTDDPLTGASMWFELPQGPASLIGFTPHAAEPSGYRFIVAEGHITERSLPQSPTVGGVFRFAGDAGVAESWRAWAAAGVNHHSACSPGHLAADVAAVAHHLCVGCVQVS